MVRVSKPESLLVFSTSLGWMAIRTTEHGEVPAIRQLRFGYDSAVSVAKAIGSHCQAAAAFDPWQESLIERLKDYSDGNADDFLDLRVDLGPLTAFQARIVRHCRAISYGKTMTYGHLAAAAGSSKAARAVGNCMAANPIPLIIPCHRVVPAQGGPGPYSALGGPAMKRRLLAMEAGHFAGVSVRLG